MFIINPNVTIGLLAFDIITTEEVIGEASVNEDFLINGTIPPLLITQAPYQSMYLLTITTGNVLDTTDTMDINFELLAFVNTLINKTEISISNVTLHKIGKALPVTSYIVFNRNSLIQNFTMDPQIFNLTHLNDIFIITLEHFVER